MKNALFHETEKLQENARIIEAFLYYIFRFNYCYKL